jgi:formylglycine-generating enzyme required for sulfatase activity
MRSASLHEYLAPPAFALLGAFLGCSDAAPRPQLLVVIDTDAPLTLQASNDPRLSFDATVDRVRVEQLDALGNLENVRVFTAPSALDWPLSFGIVSAGPITLRIQAYRALDARPPTTVGALDEVPTPATSIDRLVTLPGSSAGIARTFVFLSSDCFNTPAVLLEPRSTCVDAAHRKELPNAIPSDASTGGRTRVGTWAGAREMPCNGPAAPGRACIPGGFSRIGDSTALQVSLSHFDLPVSPARPTRVSPFFLDVTEFTVGRARPWLASLKSAAPIKKQGSGNDVRQDCTLTDSPESDAFPLNCVMPATAQELCERTGGTLPTEAQWNHAATGRGRRHLFPWGSEYPQCCTASTSRRNALSDAALCPEPGAGVEPVGSHPVTPDCPVADITPDGIVDLGGSVAEILADAEDTFDGPCWSAPGVFFDPLCQRGPEAGRVVRGSSYDAGTLTMLAGTRGAVSSTNDLARSPTIGFRCAYPDR